MTPGEKEGLPLAIEKNYKEIGELIMQDICRRIAKTKEITSTADWQINRLVGMGATSEEIEREIQKRLNLSYEQLYQLYDKVIDWEYVRNKDIYEQINANFVPYDQNEELKQLTNSIIEQTKGELHDITRSLGYSIPMNGKTVFTPLREYYEDYVDKACYEIVTGATDYNTALRKCVKQMANSGLRSDGVYYASGHVDRIEVAARRAVMTGVSQLTGKIAQSNAKALGTDYYEVEAHAGARNTGSGYLNHQAWQGRVYDMKGLQSECGLGEGGGLNGWNCYHTYYPFIPGISERNYTDEELDRMIEEENTPKLWNGEYYTTYELTQKQRQMERTMRAQRETINGLKYGDADKEKILIEQAKYKGQMSQYQTFCSKFGFQTQMERVYMDNRGRQAGSNKAINELSIKLEKDYNQGSLSANIKAYEKEQREFAAYKKRVPDAELWNYRLHKDLVAKGYIRNAQKIVSADNYKQKAYILEDKSAKNQNDKSHIMKRMLERGITDDDVQRYIDEAIFVDIHYQGKRMGFYSPNGVTILSKTNDYDGIEWIAKTVWKDKDFDEVTTYKVERGAYYSDNR